MDTNQDTQNKAVSAAGAGASADKSMPQEALADADKLAAEAKADAAVDIAAAEAVVSDAEHGDIVAAETEAKGLVGKTVDQAQALANEVLDDVEQLAEDAKELVGEAAAFVKGKLGGLTAVKQDPPAPADDPPAKQ